VTAHGIGSRMAWFHRSRALKRARRALLGKGAPRLSKWQPAPASKLPLGRFSRTSSPAHVRKRGGDDLC
jgi:hypothetical protein